jgi:hypothetical protein
MVLGCTAVALALGMPPLALSQAHAGLQLCGPAGCSEVDVPDSTLNAVAELVARSQGSEEPPSLQSFYKLELRVRFAPVRRGFYVPEAGVVRVDTNVPAGDPRWFTIPVSVVRSLRESAKRVEPFPKPQLTAVFLNGDPVPDPDPNAALWDPLPSVRPAPANADRVSITVRTRTPSPWSDGYNRLAYVPSKKVLMRSGQWIRPASSLLRLLQRESTAVMKPLGSKMSPLLRHSLAQSSSSQSP